VVKFGYLLGYFGGFWGSLRLLGMVGGLEEVKSALSLVGVVGCLVMRQFVWCLVVDVVGRRWVLSPFGD